MTNTNIALKPKQIQSFGKAVANKRFIDLSHAGTGKTPPACCLTGFVIKGQIIHAGEAATSTSIPFHLTDKPNSAKNIIGGGVNARAIWIQPSSLMEKNRKELLMWNPFLTQDQVKVVKGTALQKSRITEDPNVAVWVMTAEAFAKHYKKMKADFADIIQIVCDEPHLYYRGFKSQRTQFFANNVPNHVRIHFLTATPTPRGKLTSAYIYCHMIQKSYYGCYDWFVNTHAILDDYGNASEWVNHDVLWKFLENYSICWTAKEMYGEVDEYIVRDVLSLHPKVEEAYRGFEAQGIADIEGAVLTASSGGVESLRVRQMLAHPHAISLPIKWDHNGEAIQKQEFVLFDGITPKLERIQEYAEEGKPLIIFGSFTAEIKKIAEVLQKGGFKVGVIHGQVSQQERNKIDVSFQQGHLDIVVCSAATAGVGFNWGHVDTVIFHSLNYGDDEFLQAVARAKRGIRANPLRVVLLEYEDTIDQVIMWAVHHNSKSSHNSNKNNPIIYFPQAQSSVDKLGALGLSMDYI